MSEKKKNDEQEQKEAVQLGPNQTLKDEHKQKDKVMEKVKWLDREDRNRPRDDL